MFRVPTKSEIEEEMKSDFSTPDPWHFATSPHEMKRFQTMLEMITAVPHQSILEVGCAEGFFTQMLTEISNDVTALDISPTALGRAKKYAPNATYMQTTLEDFVAEKKYDVVVCSEVIYYTYDRPKVIQKLRQLGRYLVATNIMLKGVKPCSAEWIFRALPFPRWKLLVTPAEMKITIATIRKLDS